MQIISQARRVTAVRFSRNFDTRDMPGCGFGFECDAQGNLASGLTATARENFRRCVAGEFDLIDRGIERREWSYWEPAVGRCVCGRRVVLAGDTRGEGIDCDCGRIYNSGGQELAPRQFWGEETGERF